MQSSLRLASAFMAILLAASPLAAQKKEFKLQLPGIAGGGLFGEELALTGEFKIEKGSNKGKLAITAKMADGWHINSMTQPAGGGRPSVLEIKKTDQVKLAGKWQSNKIPHSIKREGFDVLSEEYEGTVTFTAPIELKPGVDPKTLKFVVLYSGQVCKQACIPKDDEPIDVKFGGEYETDIQYRGKNSHVAIVGHVEPKIVMPGGKVRLTLQARPDAQFHVYAYSAEPAPIKRLGGKPTLIAMKTRWTTTPPVASSEVKEKASEIPGEAPERFHEGPVSWTIEIEVPESAKAGKASFGGFIAYQVCKASACDPPAAAEFHVNIEVGTNEQSGKLPLTFTAAKYSAVEKVVKANATTLAKSGSNSGRIKTKWSNKSTLAIFGLAFLAGLILNVMPCVLPVIGLKIMSFVQQSQGNRWEIFSLNLWFSLGLMFVFAVLAAAAAFLNMGWGEHFSNVGFTVTMIGVVFAFGLSFLGVWEVPIPGFATTGAADKLAEKEGAVGAFSKGILTTILATPCSGPLLVPAVSWAVAQPAWLTFATFFFIGLGMASPYLMIGAFPGLIRLLPKPGMWMITFKQIMGFVLMGTVVFLFNSVGEKYYLATLSLLVGLGVACWWLGRTPLTAEFKKQLTSYATATAIVFLAAFLSFTYLVTNFELPWQKFSRGYMDEQIAKNNTVLVDFTADW